MVRIKFIIVNILLIGSILDGIAQSNSIVGSKHDLSVSGSGPVKTSTGETSVCLFCHPPHTYSSDGPRWNRNNPQQTYLLYDNTISNTFDAIPGQPDGSSLLCLSCHDGTIALGSILSSPDDIFGGNSVMPSGPGLLGTDLTDDHPVSFVYSSATADAEIKAIPEFPASLDDKGKVQCMSCHDAHNNVHGKFLVDTNEYSALCFKCHNRTDWDGSSHSTSSAIWNGSAPNPWGHIGSPTPGSQINGPPYATVAQNACANCHDPHSANGKTRLLKANMEENNCLDCHNANVATADIASQFTKTFRHNVSGYIGIHDPNELATPVNQHVECQDCHNPHAANTNSAVAPFASGALAGIQGIDQSGNRVMPITYEYELCNRCHSTNAVVPSYTTRQFGNNNVMDDFNPSNISHHAVVAPGNNPNPRGLLNGLTSSSQIYCTDCHASDDGVAGPHGSINERILKANYNLTESTNLPDHNDATLATEFALCAQCHDMTEVNTIHSGMDGGHFLAYTSCNSCHDPHGFPGGNVTNNSYLLNMDTSPTSLGPNSEGSFEIILNPDGTGTCNLQCHAKPYNHVGSKYTK
ncbi:MAG: cytochrome c3 family protein [Cyclobacteriaceae bacterium]|nr:cytochrome c3 family protein [Cyclobacteriaceae bacterium]